VGAAGPLKDGGRGLGVRAQRGSSPGFSGGTVAPEKKRERKKRALTCGPRVTAREGRERAGGRWS
jgi:hypothetical protein